MIRAVFWASALLVSYPYVIYPGIMVAIGRLRRRPPLPDGPLPNVSVLVAAYNEETWIARKIESTLTQDYPAERLEVIVVSDGSTDGTAAHVRSCDDPRVRLIEQPARQGKSVALNAAVQHARGEVLLFTDANALFAPGAIRRLAEHFADPGVGLVSGQGRYDDPSSGTPKAVANGYVRFEALLKRGESVLGFIAGADGAIYAMRRALYRDLGAEQVNDLLHPIQTALAGLASRFEPAACTVEPPSRDAGQELRRHVRMIAQGFEIVVHTLPLMLARRLWMPTWVLCSHRLLRWVGATGLIGLAITAPAASGGWFARAAVVGQVGFYTLAFIGWVAERLGVPLVRLSVPYYFCVVSLAGAWGML